MNSKLIEFDDDVKQLIHLLLRAHARTHKDFRKYCHIGDQMSFEIANRGLRSLGFTEEPEAAQEPKK